MVNLLPENKTDFSIQLSDLHSLESLGMLTTEQARKARRAIDEDHIYQLILSDPEIWPPILVTLTDQGYAVIDGYHRWEAARKKGMKELPAECKAFPDLNAVVDATFRANFPHGLKSSIENRSDYARWLAATYPELTQQQIADRCQLKQPTVAKALARKNGDKEKQQDEGTKPDQVRKEVIKTCKHLTQDATHLLDSIRPLPEEEQREAIMEAFSIRDRETLRRIVRLLEEVTPTSAGAPRQ
jgi:ParB-like chromosome segregation protein Spo0J